MVSIAGWKEGSDHISSELTSWSTIPMPQSNSFRYHQSSQLTHWIYHDTAWRTVVQLPSNQSISAHHCDYMVGEATCRISISCNDISVHTAGPDGEFCVRICWRGADPRDEIYMDNQHHLDTWECWSRTSPLFFLSVLFIMVASRPSIYAVKITLNILLPTG